MKPQALGLALEIIWDWSENNDVPVEVWRTEAGSWVVTVKLRDKLGWFTGNLALSHELSAPRGDQSGEMREKLYHDLSHTCQRARKHRIQTLAKKTKAVLA